MAGELCFRTTEPTRARESQSPPHKTRRTVSRPTPNCAARSRKLAPPARCAARIRSLIVGAILGRPIGFPLLVPLAFARAIPAAMRSWMNRLEDEAHRRAVEGYNPRPVYHKGKKVGEIREYSDSLLALLLKSRRPEVYARGDRAPTQNVVLNMTLQEQYKRLERLGIPLAVIESDYEDENVAANNP